LSALAGQWLKSAFGRSVLEGELAYEMALLFVAENDMDRSRYYSQLSLASFLRKWLNFNKLASFSNHECLSSVQKSYELEEFLLLDASQEISVSSCQGLFK